MNKLRIVLYGDSNTWGYSAETGERFDDDERWSQVVQNQLGNQYIVVEEGLCGRTTVFNDPLTEGLSGKKHMVPILTSHSPLDLLVIMLGTNDCKERFSATSQNISSGLQVLIQIAKTLPIWRNEKRILIIAPIKMQAGMYQSPVYGEMGRESVEKSHELPQLLQEIANLNDCHFMDSNDHCGPNSIDFMHIDKPGQINLGRAVAQRIHDILKS